MKLVDYCPYISMEMIFTSTENSKKNELQNFFLNLTQRLNLNSTNKHIAFQNLINYDLWEK